MSPKRSRSKVPVRKPGPTIVFLGDEEPPNGSNTEQSIQWRGVVQAIKGVTGSRYQLLFTNTRARPITRKIQSTEPSLEGIESNVQDTVLVIVLLTQTTPEDALAIAIARANKLRVLALTTKAAPLLPPEYDPIRSELELLVFDQGMMWTSFLGVEILRSLHSQP